MSFSSRGVSQKRCGAALANNCCQLLRGANCEYLSARNLILLYSIYTHYYANNFSQMKFSLCAVVAATCAMPGAAEVFLKEQFNDDVRYG